MRIILQAEQELDSFFSQMHGTSAVASIQSAQAFTNEWVTIYFQMPVEIYNNN